MEPRRAPAPPRTTWLVRMARGRRPDRNPLRRASDRIETAVLGLLLAAFFAAAPFGAHAAGTWARTRFTAEQRAQVSSVQQVRAVLLQAPLNWNGSLYGVGPGAVAEARWTAPDGHRCIGLIPVPSSSAAAGSTTLVWTDQAGRLADPPLQHVQVAGRVALTEGLTVLLLAVALVAVAALVRWALDRRRLAGWDVDWLATGPRWSPRR